MQEIKRGGTVSKQTLAYIGHIFHQKTRSNQFFLDILQEKYEVDQFFYDPETEKLTIPGEKKSHYDVLVLYQMPMPVKQIDQLFQYTTGNYVPMYDGTGEFPDRFWIQYRNFNIINFSKTLHERLKNDGFSSYYIKYFPKPFEHFDWGRKDGVFEWQRVQSITFPRMEAMLKKLNIKQVHLHLTSDPGQRCPGPSARVKRQYRVTTSEWFRTKDEMLKKMEGNALYIAPRPTEGIGMSFLEAMAMGRCVIAPDRPTMNEYIVSGQNGILYDLESPEIRQKFDIPTIQHNAYQSICEGYRQWEQDKYQIIDWVQKKAVVDQKKLKRTERFSVWSKTLTIKDLLLVGLDFEGRYFVFGVIRIPGRVVHKIKNVLARRRKSA